MIMQRIVGESKNGWQINDNAPSRPVIRLHFGVKVSACIMTNGSVSVPFYNAPDFSIGYR